MPALNRLCWSAARLLDVIEQRNDCWKNLSASSGLPRIQHGVAGALEAQRRQSVLTLGVPVVEASTILLERLWKALEGKVDGAELEERQHPIVVRQALVERGGVQVTLDGLVAEVELHHEHAIVLGLEQLGDDHRLWIAIAHDEAMALHPRLRPAAARASGAIIAL